MIFTENLRSYSSPTIHFDAYSEMRTALKELKQEEFNVNEINAALIGGREEFFGELSRCFNFPTVVANWDAAADWFTDLSWSNRKGYVLVIRASRHFWSTHYEIAALLLPVWNSAAEFWRQEAVPFHLIFCED